jgi:hypothetical protein
MFVRKMTDSTNRVLPIVGTGESWLTMEQRTRHTKPGKEGATIFLHVYGKNYEINVSGDLPLPRPIQLFAPRKDARGALR